MTHLKPLETAGQKWIGAWDVLHLEPLVCFILLFFFYTTNAYLGLITLWFNTVGSKLARIGCGSRHTIFRPDWPYQWPGTWDVMCLMSLILFFILLINMLIRDKLVYERGLKMHCHASQAHVSLFHYNLSPYFENRWHDGHHFILKTNLVE